MIEQRVRSTRRGNLYNSKWGERMSGHGQIAEQIGKIFELFVHKLGLDAPLPPLDTSAFTPPLPRSGQLRLF